MDRRKFLTTSAGMATAFLAMNKVLVPFLMFQMQKLVIWRCLNTELHNYLINSFLMTRLTSLEMTSTRRSSWLTKWAVGAKVNSRIDEAPMTLENYLENILDSDTKVALLSGAPFDDPWWLISMTLFNMHVEP